MDKINDKVTYRYSDRTGELLPMDAIEEFASKSLIKFLQTGEYIISATISGKTDDAGKIPLGDFVAVFDIKEDVDENQIDIYIVTEDEYNMAVKTAEMEEQEELATDIPIVKGLH